ncbi:GRAM domain-containing protein [Sporodiniella umbellata]|nr:GRAM domain-containing protein [Sporodiniella umbellata]
MTAQEPELNTTHSSLSLGYSNETCKSSFDDKTLLNSLPKQKSNRRFSFFAEDGKCANDKRNHDFHLIFESIPEEEKLLDDYGCALQKDILLQGRVYVTHQHLCFNSNIFGWITNLVLLLSDIKEIEKKPTAFFIPNAILYFFASFLSRDQAYDQLVELWRASLNVPKQGEDNPALTDDSSFHFSEEESVVWIDPAELEEQRHISLASLPAPSQARLSRSETLRRRAVSEAGPRPELEPTLAQTVLIRERTECDCSKNDQHFPTVVMDSNYTTSMETIYHLLYNSHFIHRFLSQIEKSTEIQIGSWIPTEPGQEAKFTRESSFIKYLGGSIGPKTTKCYLKEEMVHLDMNDYISQLTVTHTPDVPSGSSFQVKTRTCISYVAQHQVRVLVTVLVEFTKSSWLKTTIEKATIDGQKSYYKNLDRAIQNYLEKQQHKGKKVGRPLHSEPKPVRTLSVHQETKWLPLDHLHLLSLLLFFLALFNLYLFIRFVRLDSRVHLLESRLISPSITQDQWHQHLLELETLIHKASQNVQRHPVAKHS